VLNHGDLCPPNTLWRGMLAAFAEADGEFFA
jgi:aminoglycoside phosphotransferase